MPRKTTQTAPEAAKEKALIGTDALADAVGAGFNVRRNKRAKGERSESVLTEDGKRVVAEILVRPRVGVIAQTKRWPTGVPAALKRRLVPRKSGWACAVVVKGERDVAAAQQLLRLAVEQRGGNGGAH